MRLSDKTHLHHPFAIESVRRLAADGATFCIGSQTVSEFLAVATRPISARGLGMDQHTADAELSKVISALEVLYDSATVFAELRRLVLGYLVIGKSVHDAKLVAAMNAHAVRDILTFNIADFTRYTEIVVHDPIPIAGSVAP